MGMGMGMGMADQQKKDPQLGLGQIAAARKNLTPEQRQADYFLLPQTRRNKEAAEANAELLKNPQFTRACSVAGVTPCRRQASKWRRKMGAAWAKRNG